jgi:hypothetical protein
LGPESTGALAQIWNAAKPFADKGETVCIKAEYGPYIMLARRVSKWNVFGLDSLNGALSNANWDLVESHKGFHEATSEHVPQPNSAPWDVHKPERLDHGSEERPALYRLGGCTFEGLSKALLKSTFDSIRILELNAGKVIKSEHYPAWWQDLGSERREFFKQRGIENSRTYCTCLNEQAVDFILDWASKDAESGDRRVYSDWDHNISQCGSNALFYLGSNGHYLFEIGITADDASEDEVFRSVQTLLDLIFEGAEQSVDAECFEDFLENEFKIPKSITEQKLSGVCYLFFDDERFASYKRWWVTPDYVLIRIRHRTIDASFGTLVESEVQSLLESRTNWQKTDFERVDKSAYIGRLVRQSKQYSAE